MVILGFFSLLCVFTTLYTNEVGDCKRVGLHDTLADGDMKHGMDFYLGFERIFFFLLST